jgi:GNAT superfamily N-acetyltransferase
MRTTVVPLGRGHLDGAAELLAARQRRDRAVLQGLPPGLEDPRVAAGAVRSALLGLTSAGVAALARGGLVGYLIGVRRPVAPGEVDAAYLAPRSALIGVTAHAAEPGSEREVYRALYAALAGRWVEAGWADHYVEIVAADRAALDAWFMLGFGAGAVIAIRDTSPVAALGGGVHVRRAEPSDLESVARLAAALGRHHAVPPIFLPVVADTLERRRQRAALLADDRCPHWLAERDGRAVGLVSLVAPAPAWPGVTPEETALLCVGYTEPDVRHAGAALLRRALAWAREQGYRHCLTGWHAANGPSERFCLGVGFRPLLYRLHRRVDPRVL